MHRVSIIIPCFNCEKYLAESIDSALNQTYRDLEVIVVNDGSTDSSASIARQYGARIRFFDQSNRGAPKARNFGLRQSTGDYIQFLDADDVLYPNKVSSQMAVLTNQSIEMVTCYGDLFGDNEGLRPKQREKKTLPQFESDPIAGSILTGLGTEGPIIPRSMLEKIHGFRDVPCAQEFDLHIRLFAAGCRFRIVKKSLYKHRNHDGDRISTKQRPSSVLMEILISLLQELNSDQKKYPNLTDQHTQMISQRIFDSALSASRENDFRSLHRGVITARQFHPAIRYSSSSLTQSFATIAGYSNTAILTQTLRRLKNAIKGTRSRLVPSR